MSERLFSFLDEVLQRYFGLRLSSCPRMHRADLERLLTDDAQRRLDCARLAAAGWGSTEIIGKAGVTSECLMITPRGLLYAAGLSGSVGGRSRRPSPRSRRPLYYLATPPALFEPIADRVGAAHLLPGAAAAVDSRFGHDLVFPWPLDGALRRTLDAHEVLRLDPAGYHPPRAVTRPGQLQGAGSAAQRSVPRSAGRAGDAGPVPGARREPLFMHNGVSGGRRSERAAGICAPVSRDSAPSPIRAAGASGGGAGGESTR